LLTTEQCLLNENRNPALDKATIEARLKGCFGVEQVVWLGDGIVGDDTDGHIDDLTRFVAEDQVVTVMESDPADPNYAALQENRERLAVGPLAGRPAAAGHRAAHAGTGFPGHGAAARQLCKLLCSQPGGPAADL
jgi:agmatine deiminase